MPLVNSKLVPWPENKSYDKQAIPVPGTKRPGQSRKLLTSGTYYIALTSLMQIIIRTVLAFAFQPYKITRLFETGVWGLVDEKTPNSLTTLDQLFNDGLQIGLDSPCLGRRQVISTNPLKFAPTYTWLTYGDVDLKRRYIGSALHSLFQHGVIGGGQLQTVGIWAPNCPGMSQFCNWLSNSQTTIEWQIVDIACQTYQKVSVSLYDTLGKDSVGMSSGSVYMI